MKIALAQCNFLVGDIDGNADLIITTTQKIAAEMKADLVVFPELSLTGYPPEDLLFRPGFYKRCHRALEKIKETIDHTAVIIGYPEKIRGKIYNQAALLMHHQCIASYAKQKLPNVTVFDEKRYFTPGHQPCVFELQGIKIGLLICEDIWHKTPIKYAKKAGAELIIVINASPYHRNQVADRENAIKTRIHEMHLPVFYVNLIGGQDELVFDGGSAVFDATGHCCQQAPFYQEAILCTDVTLHGHEIQIDKKPLPKPLLLEQHVYETLKLGVKDYIRKNHFPGAILGLSGGIDSALTLAVAADALGAENVSAIIMPSQYTAKMSIEDAIAQANAMKVQYHIIHIDSLFQNFLTILSPLFQQTQPNATEENLQARIRGMLLMALSNKFGRIVLTTGNKSELSVGYATLYGDMAGGFAVIKDIPKTLVYRLARYRNTIHPAIPERVLTRAPSAELKPNQTDQDKLPSYDILDSILERYIEKDQGPTEIVAAGFNEAIVNDVINMINANEYKRRQAPIGIRITQRAFGKDRRYPVTSGYTRSK